MCLPLMTLVTFLRSSILNVLHLAFPFLFSTPPLAAGGCWKSILRICLVSYSRNVERPAFCFNIFFLVVHFTVKNVNKHQLETKGLQQLNKSLIYSAICRCCCSWMQYQRQQQPLVHLTQSEKLESSQRCIWHNTCIKGLVIGVFKWMLRI